MKKYFYFPLGLLLLFSSTVLAQGKITADVKSEYERWNSGFGGQSTAFLVGAGASYYQQKYFGGIGFVTGDYTIAGHSDDSLKRSDVDVVAGYRIDNMWSVFVGYRLNLMSYTNAGDHSEDFDETTHGLGGGVSLSQRINSKIIAFGSAALTGLVTKINYDSKGANNGTGFGVGTEAGAMYIINPKIYAALRLKYQTNRLDYSAGSWPHTYIRIGGSIAYLF